MRKISVEDQKGDGAWLRAIKITDGRRRLFYIMAEITHSKLHVYVGDEVRVILISLPPWVAAAWNDNDQPVGPLIDYLIETARPAHAAVLEEVARLLVEAVA